MLTPDGAALYAHLLRATTTMQRSLLSMNQKMGQFADLLLLFSRDGDGGGDSQLQQAIIRESDAEVALNLIVSKRREEPLTSNVDEAINLSAKNTAAGNRPSQVPSTRPIRPIVQKLQPITSLMQSSKSDNICKRKHSELGAIQPKSENASASKVSTSKSAHLPSSTTEHSSDDGASDNEKYEIVDSLLFKADPETAVKSETVVKVELSKQADTSSKSLMQSSNSINLPPTKRSRPNDQSNSTTKVKQHSAAQKNQKSNNCSQSSQISNNIPDNAKYRIKSLNCLNKKCYKAFETRNQLDSHMIEEHQTNPYQCPLFGCEKWLRTRHALEDHLAKAHASTSKWACNYPSCSKWYDNLLQLKQHYTLCHQEGCIVCGKDGCGYLGTFPSGIIVHYNARHQVDEWSALKEEEKSSKFSQIIIRQVKCTHCQATFSHPGNMEQHRKVKHGIRWYRCHADQCGKSYNFKNDLYKHIYDCHGLVNRWPCRSCSKVYFDGVKLGNHIVGTHEKGDFGCRKCDFKANIRDAVWKHYEKEHNEMKNGER